MATEYTKIGNAGDFLRFEVSYPQEKVNELLRTFKRRAGVLVAREIKKVFQDEKRNAQARLKRHGEQGDAVAQSLQVGQIVDDTDSETFIASVAEDGTATGVLGSRGINLAEMLEDGMSPFVYAFKSSAAYEKGKEIEASGTFKRLLGGKMGYLPGETMHRHPGFPRTDWLSKTADRIVEKLESDKIPRILAKEFVKHAKNKGMGY